MSTTDATGITPADRLLHIPLDKLTVDARNVRRTERRVDIDALAASIAAHGLLQSLTVVARAEGRYGVVAGARRLAALKQLAKSGRIPRHHRVACTVVGDHEAHEASLAENIQRAAMNAMDEMEAFAALVDNGASAEDVARRFGATVRHVEQRLALARLSPKIRAAYRRGELTLDAARAFCIAADHAAQERVFRQLGKPVNHARSVRNALLQGRVGADDPLARFVGLDTYEAAGGAIVRDLFEPDVAVLEDGDLLRRLAHEALDRVREGLVAEGWGWVEASAGPTSVEGLAGQRLAPVARAPTPGERADIEACRDEIARLDAALDDADDDALWQARETALTRLEALEDGLETFDPQQMAHAGASVSVDRDGRLRIVRGLIKRSALKSLGKLVSTPASSATARAEALDADAGPTPSAGERLPKVLAQTLTRARTIAIRSELAARPDIALALLVRVLLRRRALDLGHGVAITARAVHFEDREDLGGRIAERLRTSQPAGESAASLAALAARPAEDLLAILSCIVAETVDLTHDGASAGDHAVQALSDEIAAALDLDMSRHWSADEDFWRKAPRPLAFAALTTAPQVAALSDVGRQEMLARCARLKKAELAAVTAEALNGAGWLPELLVTPLAAGALALTDAGRTVLAGDASD